MLFFTRNPCAVAHAAAATAMLLTLTATTASGTGNALLNFSDGTSINVALPGTPFQIETIAGRLRIAEADVTHVSQARTAGALLVHLVNGERWRVDASSVLFNKPHDDTPERILVSATLPERQRPLQPLDHFYKIVFHDGSQAVVDPDRMTIPVMLATGKAEIPLGTTLAVKFIQATDETTPQSVIIRFASGHVWKLPYNGKRAYFTALSSSGADLRVRFPHIIGILAMSRATTAGSGTTQDRSTITFHNGTQRTFEIPLQGWGFKTGSGHIRVVSPLITRLTAPTAGGRDWEVQTMFGEHFYGIPDFKDIPTPAGDEQDPRLKLNQIQSVSKPAATVPLPDYATVFYLNDGSVLAGVARATPITLRTPDGNTVSLRNGDSLSRTRTRFFMLAPQGGGATLCTPTSPGIDICLIMNGNLTRIAWANVHRVEYSRNIRPALSAMQPPPLVAHATDDSPDARDDDTSVPRRSWWRRAPSGPPDTLPLVIAMPWGRLAVESRSITEIYTDPAARRAVIRTANGSHLIANLAVRRQRRQIQPLIDTERLDTVVPFVTSLASPPAVPPQLPVTLRLTRGDILTGTLADETIPFQPVDPADSHRAVTRDMHLRIIRTEEDTLQYVLPQGVFNAKATAQTLNIILSTHMPPIAVPLSQIEALITDRTPLPPPITFSPGLPPDLTGEIRLAGGTFTQGSVSGMPDEAPRFTVTLSPFMLDATEITRAQFGAFIRDTRYKTTAEHSRAAFTWKNPGFPQAPDEPVVCVSWLDAAAFCNWRSRKCNLKAVYTFRRDGHITTDVTADGYRLPTESEWEFAASGGRDTVYPWGSSSFSLPVAANGNIMFPANFRQREGEPGDGWRWTNPVMAFPPTPEGLYGMAGNVWQWCDDWYFTRAYDILRHRTSINPRITDADAPGLSHRAMRGGSFRNELDMLRTTSRGSGLPYAFAPHVGFRCARHAH